LTHVTTDDPPQFPNLWTPLTIGPIRAKHRVMISGHTVLYGENGFISDRHIAYYRERAVGGAALIVIEQQAAHPAGRNYHAGCKAYDPGVIPWYRKLADACRPYDCRVLVQLFCGGAQGNGTMYIDEWRPLLAASAVASTQFQELPAAMDQDDIASLIAGFRRSARHVRESGCDGIEIHAAHSQLLGSFLSPAFNRRNDGYGGNIANRCRIVLEIAEAVRREADGLAMGLRLSASEFLPRNAGITPGQTQEQLEIFANAGLFDFFDISAGGYYAKHISVTPQTADLEQGFLAPHARDAKLVVGERAKVFVVGRVLDLGVAERIVADGAADMVALTRAHMADPLLVAKARDGRASEIVRCVGANVCVRRLGEHNHVVCMMNPAMGREAKWGAGTLAKTGAAKHVVVIGAGPAGMKAAAVAAERGHRVTVFERQTEPGGRLRPMAALPSRTRWGDAIANLAGPLHRLGVDLRLGEAVDQERVAGARADVIVVATGAEWSRSGFSAVRPERERMPGAEQPHVIDIQAALNLVLEDPGALGRRVMLVDESHDIHVAGIAEILARAGVSVEIVTPHMFWSDALARAYDLTILMPRLKSLGVVVTPQHFIERIDGEVVQLYDIWRPDMLLARAIDTVVLAQTRVASDGLYRRLLGRAPAVHRIGDCLAPRAIEAVIYEGEELGRAL
jgi:2,4-dienoyl-CoA reductase-like NADH-dependent reductase (Old Yellow Enzyme family)